MAFWNKKKRNEEAEAEAFLKSLVSYWGDLSEEELAAAKIVEIVYKKILAITKKSKIVHNAQFEIFPAMFVVADFAAMSTGKNRELWANAVLDVFSKYTSGKGDELDRRIYLYGEILRREKNVRAEWYMGADTAAITSHPATLCAAVLCDILVNPLCAENYDSAPVVLRGFDKNTDFTKNVALPIGLEYIELFKKIYSF